jgi:hypothetical protein
MIMKKLIAVLTLALIAAGPARAMAQDNIEKDRGYLGIDKAFDFKTIKPEVNINLPKFLLKDALADMGGKDDPLAKSGINLSELIQDVKLIRVVVMEGRKEHGEAIAKGVAALRASLEKNWTPITAVSEGKEHVGVYAISDASGESTAGLALLIHDGNEAVIANIVGKVSIGKILSVASKMDKFPKDLLKKLSGAAGGEKESGKKDGEKTKGSEEKEKNAEKAGN